MWWRCPDSFVFWKFGLFATSGLRGTRSNRQGLGAVVTALLADGRRVTKVMDGKSGYLSQSDLPLYFGLGAFDHLTSLEVRWPAGARQTTGPVNSTSIEVVEW